jgi:hypothetical protein
VKEKPGPFAQVAALLRERAAEALDGRTPHEYWQAIQRERVTKAELAAMPVSGVTH